MPAAIPRWWSVLEDLLATLACPSVSRTARLLENGNGLTNQER